jgi:hypothetical protein
VFWNVAITSVFLYAVYKLPFSDKKKSFFAWLLPAGIHYGCNLFPVQYYLDRIADVICNLYLRKKTQSAFSILIGTFVKVYGIVGLSAFFLLKTNFGLF